MSKSVCVVLTFLAIGCTHDHGDDPDDRVLVDHGVRTDGLIGADGGSDADMSDGTSPGTGWTNTTPSLMTSVHYFESIWGSGPDDVYVVGYDAENTGYVFHTIDGGQSWSAQTNDAAVYNAVWGTGANNVYIAGGSNQANGAVLEHSVDGGKTWTSLPISGAQNLGSMWGSGPNDIYVTGDYPIFVQHSIDGAMTWKQVTAPVTLSAATTVWGTAAKDVYIAGEIPPSSQGVLFHTSDGGKTVVELNDVGFLATQHSVWSNGSELFATGLTGLLRSSDGGTQFSNTPLYSGTLELAWGSAANDLYVGGVMTFAHSTDGGLTFTPVTGPTFTTCYSMWGWSAARVFVACDNQLWRGP